MNFNLKQVPLRNKGVSSTTLSPIKVYSYRLAGDSFELLFGALSIYTGLNAIINGYAGDAITTALPAVLLYIWLVGLIAGGFVVMCTLFIRGTVHAKVEEFLLRLRIFGLWILAATSVIFTVSILSVPPDLPGEPIAAGIYSVFALASVIKVLYVWRVELGLL